MRWGQKSVAYPTGPDFWLLRQSGSDISIFLGKDQIQTVRTQPLCQNGSMTWSPKNRFIIKGDGETSRDFCYIEYRLLAVACDEAANQIYNMAGGDRTTLNDLFELIRTRLTNEYPHLENFKPIYQDFHTRDERLSLAVISKAKNHLGYCHRYCIGTCIDEALNSHVKDIIG